VVQPGGVPSEDGRHTGGRRRFRRGARYGARDAKPLAASAVLLCAGLLRATHQHSAAEALLDEHLHELDTCPEVHLELAVHHHRFDHLRRALELRPELAASVRSWAAREGSPTGPAMAALDDACTALCADPEGPVARVRADLAAHARSEISRLTAELRDRATSYREAFDQARAAEQRCRAAEAHVSAIETRAAQDLALDLERLSDEHRRVTSMRQNQIEVCRGPAGRLSLAVQSASSRLAGRRVRTELDDGSGVMHPRGSTERSWARKAVFRGDYLALVASEDDMRRYQEKLEGERVEDEERVARNVARQEVEQAARRAEVDERIRHRAARDAAEYVARTFRSAEEDAEWMSGFRAGVDKRIHAMRTCEARLDQLLASLPARG